MQREAGVRWGLVSVALLAFLAVPAAQADNGLIGPQLGLLNNGRELRPAGRLVDLGNFPTGGAVTPNSFSMASQKPRQFDTAAM